MNFLKRPEAMVVSVSTTMVPIVTAVSFCADNGLVVAPLISIAFAIFGIVTLYRQGPVKPLLGLALIGQAIAFTAALTGHPWQIDSHMVFFAFLAMLIALIDIPTIIVATAAITVHHLGLTFSLPALVYPSADLFGNIERTLIHAVIVLAESAAIIVTIRRLHTLAREGEQRMQEVARATLAAEEARDSALAAKAEADEQRRSAEQAKRQSEHALADLEAKQQQANEANERARIMEENERSATKKNQEAQDKVVASLGRGLKALAEGDLSANLAEPFTADYEDLRLDFNRAIDALSRALMEVSAHASNMLADTGQISEAAGALSRRAEHQAGRLEQTTAAMEEVTKIVGKTAASATEAASSVAGARSSAAESGRVVARASGAMAEIDASASQINNIIDVIDVIDQIAFQTNLLALNAGVEAARAGDAGLGYAVVASEVRALAQRSSEAAKDISALIVKSQSQVSDGVRFVGETVTALNSVNEAVSEISRRVDDIASSATTQATTLGEINTAVVEIDKVTKQNTAMIEETAAAAQALRSASEEMQRLTGRFHHQEKASARHPVSGRAA